MGSSSNLFTFKLELNSCRIAAETNIAGIYNNGILNNGIGATLSANSVGALVIQGVTLNQNDDILLSMQTILSQNGIYTVTQTGSASTPYLLTRRTDFQSIEQMKSGQFTPITAGQFIGSIFILAEPIPQVMGQSPINFYSNSGSIPPGVFLQVTNNLSDVASVPTSRTNLGLGTGSNVTFNSLTTPMFSEVTVNTTTTLTAANFGKNIVCVGAASYTITLPTPVGNAGKYIDFTFLPTANALVTLLPPSGTIDGQPSLIYGANEGCTLRSDGTNYSVIWQKLQPVNFMATQTIAQTIPNTGNIVVVFDTVNFDIGNFFNTGTNTYTPLYPGKYLFSACIFYVSSSPDTFFGLLGQLYKNGILAVDTSFFVTHLLMQPNLSPTSAPTFMNGTTDSMNFQTFQDSTGSLDTFPMAPIFFGATRISNF